MTNEEAINKLQFIRMHYPSKDIENIEADNALSIAIETLKEQLTGYWRQIGYDIYECTVCSQNVMTGDICAYKHCHGCGAKMKETPCTDCKHEGSFGKEFDDTCMKCKSGSNRTESR